MSTHTDPKPPKPAGSDAARKRRLRKAAKKKKVKDIEGCSLMTGIKKTKCKAKKRRSKGMKFKKARRIKTPPKTPPPRPTNIPPSF